MPLSASKAYSNMTDYLSGLYGNILFQRGGLQHPITVFQPDAWQIDDVDSILAEAPRSAVNRESFLIYDHGHLQSLQNAGRSLFNGTTFSYKGLRRSPLKLYATLGKYYDMLATCGALERELRDSALDRFIRLPARAQFHRQVGPNEALSSGRGRDAAVGVATLIVFNDNGVYKAILAQRSRRAATDPLFYHVIPAFIFQPSDDSFQHAGEWSVRHQIYREYLEELFGMAENTAPERDDYFAQHPALLDLQSRMARGGAALYLTGLVLNLLTLRPEICALLLIHDPDWFPAISQGGEWTIHAAESEDGRLITVPIENDEAFLGALPPDIHLTMPPQAVGAVWLGIDLAREKLARK